MSETTTEFPGKILEQLQDVNCELLGGRNESWLWELVFSSSDNHNQFLKWILCSFDEDLESTFKNMLFQSLSTDDQQKQLHQICCSIGFCKENDLNIINGTADKESIRNFWELILDLHLTHVTTLKNGNDKCFQSKNISGICELDSSTSSDVTLSTKMIKVKSQKMSSPFKLLPPDLEFEAREFAKTHSIKSPTKQQVAEMLLKTEEQKCRELEADNKQDLHEQIVSTLSDLKEMVLEFAKCHQKLQPWLKEQATQQQANSLGDLVKVSSEKLAKLQKLLDGFQLESEYQDLSKADAEHQKPADVNVDGNSHIIDTLNEAINPRKRK